jgi:DNA-binding transcriptional LysR family regulator
MNQHLSEIIAFYYVANFKSYTKAAEALKLSKAQISRQVKTLETHLNLQLFHRTTRSLSLTEEGRNLFIISENIVRLSQEAALTMKEMTGDKHGMIRLTAPSSLDAWLGVPFSTELRRKYPDMKVEFDFSNNKKSLIQDGYDFALRALHENDPELVSKFIGHVRDVIIASPEFLRSLDSPITRPQQLAGIACLIPTLSAQFTSWKFRQKESVTTVEVNGKLGSNTYHSIKLLCLGGLGVAKLPLYLVKEEIESKKLVCLLPDYEVSTHALYLVYPARSFRPTKQEVFKDMLLSWFASQDYAFL